MDKYYSPAWLARALCEHFSMASNPRVFDPTMGAGALLDAAVEKSAPDTIVAMGCDIDPRTVRSVRRDRPEWMIGRADIYSAPSRRQSEVWKTAKQSGVDVVLMNPPFSFRGNRRRDVSFLGETYSLTPAVAALAIVLDEVETSQGVGAILPAGSLHGESNELFWSAVERRYKVSLAQDLPRGSFPDARASSVLLTLRKLDKSHPSLKGLIPPNLSASYFEGSAVCRCVEVIRGRIQTRAAVQGEEMTLPFVHTTNLRDGKLVLGVERRPASLSTSGPMLLLPRVGKFYFEKLVITDSLPVVLSDCVIALRAGSPAVLERVRSLLVHPATGFDKDYGGTGAPYITVRKLLGRLSAYGLAPRHTPASSGPFECVCRSSEPVQNAS